MDFCKMRLFCDLGEGVVTMTMNSLYLAVNIVLRSELH